MLKSEVTGSARSTHSEEIPGAPLPKGDIQGLCAWKDMFYTCFIWLICVMLWFMFVLFVYCSPCMEGHGSLEGASHIRQVYCQEQKPTGHLQALEKPCAPTSGPRDGSLSLSLSDGNLRPLPHVLDSSKGKPDVSLHLCCLRQDGFVTCLVFSVSLCSVLYYICSKKVSPVASPPREGCGVVTCF